MVIDEMAEKFDREELIDQLSTYISNNVLISAVTNREKHRRFRMLSVFCRFLRSRVTFSLVHIVLKVLYMVIIICVKYILSAFFNIEFFEWGLVFLRQAFDGDVFWGKELFPIVSFCDVRVLNFGAEETVWTFQCILTVNMMYEKIFFVVWVVLFLVFFVSFLNLTYSIFDEFFAISKENVSRYVNAIIDEPPQFFSGQEFVDDFLGDQCVRYINYIVRVFGEDFAFRVTENLWKFYVSFDRDQLVESVIGLR